jgi:hypothetical protein
MLKTASAALLVFVVGTADTAGFQYLTIPGGAAGRLNSLSGIQVMPA